MQLSGCGTAHSQSPHEDLGQPPQPQLVAANFPWLDAAAKGAAEGASQRESDADAETEPENTDPVQENAQTFPSMESVPSLNLEEKREDAEPILESEEAGPAEESNSHLPEGIIDGAATGAEAGALPMETPTSDPAQAVVAASQEASSSANQGSLNKSTGSILFQSDLDSESMECWASRPDGKKNRKGCGAWTGIGDASIALVDGEIRRSGTKSLRITYNKNENVGSSSININSDNVHFRSYFYFDKDFDFGQGVKIGRLQAFNKAASANDIDVIMTVRSSAGPQCGVTDMADMGVFYNGRPLGFDWGNVTGKVSLERGRWYALEYQVALNTPGKKDGIVRIWIDGKLLVEKTDLNIRGNLPKSVNFNRAMVGGWYSNGAKSNACPDPAAPSRIYMDDIVISKEYIGTN